MSVAQTQVTIEGPAAEVYEETAATELERMQNKPGLVEGKKPRKAWIWLGAVGVMIVFLFGLLLRQGKDDNGPLALLASATPTETSTVIATATLMKTFTVTATALKMKTSSAYITATTTPIPDIGSIMVSEKDGMLQVYVPAGEFEMGSTEGDIKIALTREPFHRSGTSSASATAWPTEGVDMSEVPLHTVYLDAFWMDRTEVTSAMYAAFLNEQGNQIEGGETWLDDESGRALIVLDNGSWQPVSGNEDHPVVNVSWYGAQAYCEWAGRRLPTEAEWEKAARGTDGRTFPWGNESPSQDMVNYIGGNDGYEYTTAPVGNFPKGVSPYGALDMAGNVREWVNDWYDENYYTNSPVNNPQGPTDGEFRVLHGGSWRTGEYSLRSANRLGYNPENVSISVGFRCAVSADSL